MDERRGGTAGTRSVYDRHPAWRWVDAIAWLGDLMHQEIMGEPYEDVRDYLIANPCDEYWCIGHDFDMAVTSWVVESAVRDRDSCRVAYCYMDGLRPPAWSRCSKFLEEGLAKGDFNNIRAETDPDMLISLQRLVDDIPADLEDRWDEIPEGDYGDDGFEASLRAEMYCRLDWRDIPEDLEDVIQRVEGRPLERLWSLGWKFDRVLLRRLAVWIVFCRTTPDELIALPAVLRMPDNVKDVSLVERLRVKKVWFLDSCERSLP